MSRSMRRKRGGGARAQCCTRRNKSTCPLTGSKQQKNERGNQPKANPYVHTTTLKSTLNSGAPPSVCYGALFWPSVFMGPGPASSLAFRLSPLLEGAAGGTDISWEWVDACLSCV